MTEREKFEKAYIANRLLTGLNEGQAKNSLESSIGERCWQIWQLAKSQSTDEMRPKVCPDGDGYYWVRFVDTWRMCKVYKDQLWRDGNGFKLTDFPDALFFGPMPEPPISSSFASDEEESSSHDSSSETEPKSSRSESSD